MTPRRKTRLIQCADCGEVQPFYARQWCQLCYGRRAKRQLWTGPPPAVRKYTQTGTRAKRQTPTRTPTDHQEDPS
jgi:hypothetical protein